MSSIYNFFYPKNSITGQRELWYLPTSVGTMYGHRKQCEYRSKLSALTISKNYADHLVAMQARVDRIVHRLAVHAQRPGYPPLHYQATLIDTNDFIAQSYPGGKILVSIHFIERVLFFFQRKEGEEGLTENDILAGPIAHEMAHVALGHAHKQIETALFCYIGSILSSFGLGTTALACLFKHPFSKNKKIFYPSLILYLFLAMETQYFLPKRSRKREYEADKFGIYLMHKAHYDMRGSLAALNKVPSFSTGEKIGVSATHPPVQKRLEANRNTIEEIEKHEQIA